MDNIAMPEKGGNKNQQKRFDAKAIVTLGLLTAIVAVLQGLSVGIRFGMFSITLTLVPIIVGAALYGWKAGAWLGAVFGVVVLLTDAGAFLAVNIPGTIVTVLIKGIAAGAAAGLIYTLIAKKSSTAAVITAAAVSPIVNTGIFLLGCRVFFWDFISQLAISENYESAGAYILFGMVGINFLVELGVNLVLSSAIVTIVNLAKKKLKA